MYLEINADFYNEVKSSIPEDSSIHAQATKGLRFSSTDFDLDLRHITLEDIQLLHNLAKEKGDKSLTVEVAKVRNLMEDLEGRNVTSIKALVPAMLSYFKKDVIDGWLYHVEDGAISPYSIHNIKYTKPTPEQGAYVTLTLVANSHKADKSSGHYTKTLTFDFSDVCGKTLPVILADLGYFHETPFLRELYLNNVEKFMKYQAMKNEQFWIEKGTYTQTRQYDSSNITSRSKAVNDEGLINRKFKSTLTSPMWELLEKPELDNIPYHCAIYMFSLTIHKNIWVDISRLTPYEYNPSLKDKLVLPEEHKDIIDILVSDIDILKPDIIEGKSGGTTILCTGTPGLGKTLSAEVYSEVIQRPLYRVHSGQLGITPSEVENSLEAILKRAERWGAVLLLDEADVYIRRRGDDLKQNVVVAAFLRTLEYFSGLLFMTTNRGEDVDDAILSRCIAVIKYVTPSPEDAKKIWRVLSDNFSIDLSDTLIDVLVVEFPKLSGRDIKELLKLTSRWVDSKKVPYSIEVFRQCSKFRGI